MFQMKLKKLGLVLSGPSLVILYSDGDGKTRKRTMPIRDLRQDSDCRLLAARIKTRHSKYLGGIKEIKLEKLIRLVQAGF